MIINRLFHRFLLVILLFTWSRSVGQSVEDCPLAYGFPGLDTSRVATLHVLREKDTTYQNYWQSLYMDQQHILRANQWEKYSIRLAKVGEHEFWTGADYVSSVTITIEKGKDYFLFLTFRPGKDHPEPIVKLMDTDSGALAFEADTSQLVTLNYPVPRWRKVYVLSPILGYINRNETLKFDLLFFSQPTWANCVECFEGMGYCKFSYFDSVASPTYSEFAIARFAEESRVKDSLGFSKYLKKKALKNLLDKEDELIIQENVELNLPGVFTHSVYIEAKDLDANNRGQELSLIVRSIYSVIIVKKDKVKKVYEFIYSERGKQEELWSKNDLTCRAKDFLSTIQLR